MKLFKNHSFRNKLPRSLNLRQSDQSGQAMIEYILVVIISVTMLFVAKGVFSNINNYISGYVGGYFKCLMTQGELPALGVKDGDLSKHTGAGYKCSAAFQKSNVAGSDGSGGGKNLGTTTQLSSPPKGSTKETASSRGTSSSTAPKKPTSAKAKGINNSGDDDSGTRFSSTIRNRSEPYSSSDGEGDDGVRSVPMARRDLGNEKSGNSRRISGELNDALKKKMRGRGDFARRSNGPKNISAPGDDLRPGPRRTKFNPPQRGLAATVADPEVEMGFGYFLKWIMIAGIGIAIFIFFGGQIMNYNNSDG
ncbi:MAG: Flp family type IVb pilin [Moraxellaceae bacterium]|nr:Flp family type IVb pilin [Pseudobdellovibrionaceae bacterium]